jgi:hypothetical protein
MKTGEGGWEQFLGAHWSAMDSPYRPVRPPSRALALPQTISKSGADQAAIARAVALSWS